MKQSDPKDWPRPTTAVTRHAWKQACEIVSKAVGASNETYIHDTILRDLCENIAGAIDYAHNKHAYPV